MQTVQRFKDDGFDDYYNLIWGSLLLNYTQIRSANSQDRRAIISETDPYVSINGQMLSAQHLGMFLFLEQQRLISIT